MLMDQSISICGVWLVQGYNSFGAPFQSLIKTPNPWIYTHTEEIQARKKRQESISIPIQKPIVRSREKKSKNRKKW
jgi:hypothetical protein